VKVGKPAVSVIVFNSVISPKAIICVSLGSLRPGLADTSGLAPSEL